ncbi:MAG TPA: hypothetical protein VMY99_00890 [Nevskiaceae bacterium]|nr:hypothetical protein [Nevskiaceae bacterium]
MAKAYIVKRRARKAAELLKNEGFLNTLIFSLQRLQKTQQRTSRAKKIEFSFLAHTHDILKANWSATPYKPPKTKTNPPYTINWVMSPPGKGGGGHQNIFRFIHYLERQGHTCRVYLYSVHAYRPVKDIRQDMAASYPKTKASMKWLKGPMAPADTVFATGWETAYPVFNDAGSARKFYFVQDFEPYFYSVGSEYVLAENTYKFNFHGITAGGFLAKKLHTDYGMQCDNYEFGADTSLYRFENKGQRKEVFFYARPVTTRRGFELGIMTLQLFHEQQPDYKIVLAGWDVSEYDIPFPYENLKELTLGQLSDVYNRCAAGLVISLTNMSLLPLELLAAGTIPVVNDGPNNRLVSNNAYIKYAEPSPSALAQALVETVTRPDLPEHAKKAAQSVAGLDWEQAGKKMEAALVQELSNG